jgi:SHAQKYF class myb-like DNA-binding protein
MEHSSEEEEEEEEEDAQSMEEDGSNVQSNTVQTGPWTSEENEKFFQALKIYGKNWTKIQKFVQTRSRPQIRSHT